MSRLAWLAVGVAVGWWLARRRQAGRNWTNSGGKAIDLWYVVGDDQYSGGWVETWS